VCCSGKAFFHNFQMEFTWDARPVKYEKRWNARSAILYIRFKLQKF